MAEWKRKRVWSSVEVRPLGNGYGVFLDGRPATTPAGAELIAPVRPLAKRIAAEWQAQTGTIDPALMPVTRLANAAIDKIGPQSEAVAGMLAAYGGSDLICYRADGPPALTERQTRAWTPLLDWAAEALDARLHPTQGVMFQAQPENSLSALRARVSGMTGFELAAFHDLVVLSGSLILAFAVTRGRLRAETAWDISRIDEDWQSEHWGEDEEARAAATAKKAAFLLAAETFRLLSNPASDTPNG